MAEQTEPLTIIAVADVEIVDNDPESHFIHTREILRGGDITFGQLEIPLANSGEGQLGGGLRNRGFDKDPRKSARILADIGFNVMSHAGNHTMDMSERTLFDTMDAVAEETDIQLIGVGRNLSEARRPAIFDVKGVRVGFLANTSVPIDRSWAEERVLPNGNVMTRSGVNPLRAHTSYEDVDFQPGNKPQIATRPDAEDLERMLADIRALRDEVDVVIVSCHWGVHFEPATIATYQVEAGHAAIDAGADLIFGHHPHTIKGVEYYKDKAILYGMPNFNLGIRDQHEAQVTRWVTLESEKSLIAKITVTDKKISRIAFIPCHLDFSNRQPTPLAASDPRAADIRKYLEWVDANNTPDFWAGTKARRAFAPFTTTYRFDGDELVLEP